MPNKSARGEVAAPSIGRPRHTGAKRKMAQDAAAYYRNAIGALTDAIRISDFKANVAIVFVAIMMGPVVAARDKFPPYLPLALAMAPFLIIFFCLLVCLFPRYPRQGRLHFIIARNADPDVFRMPDNDDAELERQQTTCALLSRILYWKTAMLNVSYYTCIASVLGIAALVAYSWL
jgi:hypothetical protein